MLSLSWNNRQARSTPQGKERLETPQIHIAVFFLLPSRSKQQTSSVTLAYDTRDSECPPSVMRARMRQRFQLLYLLVSANIVFFVLTYRRLVLINPSSIHLSIRTFVSHYVPGPAAVCRIPEFDPWDQTIAKSIRIPPVHRCPTYPENLIDVVNFTQLAINQTVNRTSFSNSISHCVYLKIDRNPEEKYFRDWSYTLSKPVLIVGGRTAPILDADFVLTRCYGDHSHPRKFW